MKKLSNGDASTNNLREQLLGLGEDSLRKSYYPELQKQLENLSEQVELAKLVAEIAQGLAEEKDLGRSLQRCTDSLVRRTEAIFVRIWTVDPSGEILELQASSGLHTNVEGEHSRIAIQDYPYKIGSIAREQKSLLCKEVLGNPIFHNQEWIKQNRIVEFAGFPLIVEKGLVGIVALFTERSFSTAVLDTLSTIISQISVGIERKRSEVALASYKDNLEILIEERTLQLKEVQTELLQNERLATLGRLTATVSHELRNPLGTIQAAVFSIENSLQNKEYSHIERSLELAERNIARCVNIIEDLTDFTRVKKMNIDNTPIDDWLRELFGELIIPNEIQCELDLSCEVAAQVDREKLRQVMVNLISNALDALQSCEPETKAIKISSRHLDSHYEITVEDNGLGMSEETLDQIFEPLYSTKGFGVGLGMVIVKNIVERHHGEIKVQSKAGEGTTVTLNLPTHFPPARG